MDAVNKKVNIDVDTISVLYRHYKQYLLPLGIIAASFLVLFFIVIPQTQQYLTNSDSLKTEQQKLEILRNNNNFLSNLDESKTNDQLQMLSAVLPSGKDFAGVMNSISLNASKANVSVENFEFQVGDLSKGQEMPVTYPFLKLSLKVSGSTSSLMSFMNSLNKSAPVAQINTIKLDGNEADLDIFFYYKPFPAQAVSDEEPISDLTSKDNAFLTELSSWGNVSNQSSSILLPLIPSGGATETSSSSGETSAQPF